MQISLSPIRISLMAFLPLALACGDGAEPAGGADASVEETLPDAGEDLVADAPEIEITACPDRIVLGEAGSFAFRVDAAHRYSLEADGQSPGAGPLLDEGEGDAEELIGVQISSDTLGLGEHELRLYAQKRSGSEVASAICTTTIVSSLRVLYLNGRFTENSASMVRQAMELDPRIGSVDLETYGTLNPSPPSLEEMLDYDVVMFSWFNASTFASGSSFGNRFADYVDAGGSLMLLGHSMDIDTLLGRLVTSEYVALRPAEPGIHSGVHTLVPVANEHQALDDVSAMSTSEHTVTTVADGATLIAEWDDGDPLLAIKGKVVNLTARIASNDAELSGDWEELLINAALLATEATP